MADTNKVELEKDIFELLGLKDAPDNEKAEIFAKILEVIQLRVIKRIGDELSEKDIDELNKLLDKDGDEAEEFLEKKLPNYNEFFKEEAEKYKTQLIIKTQEE